MTAAGPADAQPQPPKRAMNPYMIFLQERRGVLQSANPQMSGRQVVSHVAQLWRDLPEEEKQPYIEKANVDKARFHTERDQWIADGPPKKPMNSFLIFAQEHRKRIVDENPGMSVREIVAHTASMWGQLSDADKQPYIQRAAVDKAQFEQERERWLSENKDSKRRRGGYHPKRKAAKQKKLRKQKNTVKRVSPAYIFFSTAHRRAVQAANPDWKIGDVSRELGRLWRELPEAERQPYISLHEADKERHRRESMGLNQPSRQSASSSSNNNSAQQHAQQQLPPHFAQVQGVPGTDMAQQQMASMGHAMYIPNHTVGLSMDPTQLAQMQAQGMRMHATQMQGMHLAQMPLDPSGLNMTQQQRQMQAQGFQGLAPR